MVLAITAGVGLAFGLPGPLEPLILVAKVLAALGGASLTLVSGERLAARLRPRLGAARIPQELVAGFLAGAVAAIGVAHALLPPAAGNAAGIARFLVLASMAAAAGHGGVALARRSLVARAVAESAEWRSRPVQSAVMRAVTVLVPIGASFVCAMLMDRALPPPPTTFALIGRIGLVLFVSYIVLFLVERMVRRLGPLAMLYRLSLAFPGDAPSRFAIARRSRNPHALRQQLELARQGDDRELSRAAETVLALATALTAHDSKTRGHSERVRVFTDMLAEELRLPRSDRDRLRWAALLHDIGKLSVSPRILNKAGPLDRAQWRVIKRHPEEGARILEPLAPWLGSWMGAVEQHHEKYDGSGYPHGLVGDQISLGGRIITVADAYDTMTAARPYRAAMTAAAARHEVERCAGTHFDPLVARALLNLSIRRLWWRMGLASWLAQIPLLGRVPQAVAPVGELAATGVRTAAAFAGVAAATALPTVGSPVAAANPSVGVSVQSSVAHNGSSAAGHRSDHGSTGPRGGVQDDKGSGGNRDTRPGGRHDQDHGHGHGHGHGPGGSTGPGPGAGSDVGPGETPDPGPGGNPGPGGGSGDHGPGPSQEPEPNPEPNPAPDKDPKGGGPPPGVVPPGHGGTVPPGHDGQPGQSDPNGNAYGHDKDKTQG